MVKNPLIRKMPKMTGNTTGGHKSAGILDDHAIRKNIATKEGTIEKVPVDDSDITNKKYVDDLTDPALLNDSMADTLHRHSELSASDGTPDATLKVATGGHIGIGTTTPNESLTLGADGVLSIDERAAAPTATAAHGKLWVKNTTPSELWFTDDAGTSTKII